ncbi:hypothetical protein SAMN05216428_104125 [Nitrosospira sp. Nsp11]|nr:hypothetical protein SAMN05216428_104125 [Nitrosospira sp. Nsp11]
MSICNMPGFTAEASVYSSGHRNPIRADGVSKPFNIVEAAQNRTAPMRVEMSARRPEISVADFHFQTAWLECFCSTTEGWCSCMPRRDVITA